MIPTKMRKTLGGFRRTCPEGVAGLVLSLVLGATLVASYGPAWAAPGGPQTPSPKPDIPQTGPATEVQPKEAFKLTWTKLKYTYWIGQVTPSLYASKEAIENKNIFVKFLPGEPNHFRFRCWWYEDQLLNTSELTDWEVAYWKTKSWEADFYLFRLVGNVWQTIDHVSLEHPFSLYEGGGIPTSSSWYKMMVLSDLEPGVYMALCQFGSAPTGTIIPSPYWIETHLVIYEEVPPDAFMLEFVQPAPKQVYAGLKPKFQMTETVKGFRPTRIDLQVQRLQPAPELKGSILPVFEQGAYINAWSNVAGTKLLVEWPEDVPVTTGWHRVQATSHYDYGKIDGQSGYQTSPWRYFFVTPLPAISLKKQEEATLSIPGGIAQGLGKGKESKGQTMAKLPPGGLPALKEQFGKGPRATQGLKLLSSRVRSGGKLELKLFRSGGSRTPTAQQLEFRLHGKKVGEKRLVLAAGKEHTLLIDLNELSLPPGTRGLQRLDVYAGAQKIGVAQINLGVRGRGR